MPESRLDTAESGIRQPAQYLSHEGLTLINADGRAVPGLAREWVWENNGLTLRVLLREEVKLHDGSSLTAETVVNALRTVVSRPQNQLLYPSFANIRTVRADGDLTVVLDLARPAAFLPEDLSLRLGVGPDNLGTGAFRIINADAQAIELERFDDYHGGKASIERVVIRAFPTLRTAWTSLLRGEVDMVSNVPPDAIEFISSDDVQMLEFARPFQFMVAFNSQSAPFKSSPVRRALNLAIDREAVVARVLQGKGVPSTGPISPQHWAYDRSIPGYVFDPGQAQSMLDAAGLRVAARGDRSGERFSFVCLIPAGFALVERVALEVQRQLYNIGVDVQFEVLPIAEFDARVREGRFQAMLIDMVSAPGISRSQMFWRSAKEIRGLNVFGYENTEAERLFKLLSESTNEAAVRSATSRLQRVFLDDPPALFLAWTQGSRAVRRQFTVVEEAGRDPLYTVWRWTPTSGGPQLQSD